LPTLHQLSVLNGRGKKRRRSLVAALLGAPHRKGVISKIGITTPRKPNSAKRKFAKVRIIVSKKVIFAHIPGIGRPAIQEYSIVMVEGGNPPDVPGVNYTLIRGLYDFDKYEEYGRKKRRSKFGVKKPYIYDRYREPKIELDDDD